jgi:hypothetical protein
MAIEKIPTVYELIGHEIHKKKGDSNEVIANYYHETKTVTYVNASFQRWHSESVNAFLASNELLVRDILRDDLPKDPPLTKAIPPRPKKSQEGDKTPEVVQWYYTYRPNQFKARYRVIGTYSGKVVYNEAIWIHRKGDGMLEYRGSRKIEDVVSNVILAHRATTLPGGKRLTYTPEECPDFQMDDEADDLAMDAAVVEDNQS